VTGPGAGSWQPDPEGRFEYRWWDGRAWTDDVSHQGQVHSVPLVGAAQSQAAQPAAQPQADQPQGYDRSQADQPQSYGQPRADQPQSHGQQHDQPQGHGQQQAHAAQGQSHAAQPQHAAQGQSHAAQPQGYGQAPQDPGAQPQGDGFAGITGDLVDGRFSEKESKAVANQNSKLLRVRLGEPFMARQGSMVAYQGNVDFAFEGGGASKFLKKALTGEGVPLMRCQGQGDVFLAELAHDVHLLNLTNSGLSVSGKNILAFSSSLEWNIERVKGGSIAAGGLFNTTLRGTGWVAITTDGSPVVLNAAEAPTFADTNAVVAWSANLQTQLKTSFKAGALIGRGSGEALQVAFHGQGFVIVQPSEGIQIATV
jgi:uncharacterized protein (AIM24 family)